MSRHVKIRYFLSKIDEIRAKSQKNGCKSAESWLHTFSHSALQEPHENQIIIIPTLWMWVCSSAQKSRSQWCPLMTIVIIILAITTIRLMIIIIQTLWTWVCSSAPWSQSQCCSLEPASSSHGTTSLLVPGILYIYLWKSFILIINYSFNYLIIYLFNYLIIWLFNYLIIYLFNYLII